MSEHLGQLALGIRKNPSDSASIIRFMKALQDEDSIDVLESLLPIDYEHIAGHVLLRIADVLPEPDTNLLSSIALWYYQLGCDDEAVDFLERAKKIDPLNKNVLRLEIYMSFGKSPELLKNLCSEYLTYYPNDEWIVSLRDDLEKKGQLTMMKGRPVESKWEIMMHNQSK